MSYDPPPVTPPPAKNKTLLYVGIGGGCLLLLLVVLAAGGIAFYFMTKAKKVARVPAPPVPLEQPEEPVAPPAPAPAPPALPAPPAPAPARAEPFNTKIFVNSREGLDKFLGDNYLAALFAYPGTWTMNTDVRKEGRAFVRVQRPTSDADPTTESFQIGAWARDPKTSDQDTMKRIAEKISDAFAKSMENYRELAFAPTRVGLYEGMELRFSSLPSAGAPLWGRVIFFPRQTQDQQQAPILTLLAAGNSSVIRSVDDVGVKGEMPLVLNTLRWGAEYTRAGQNIQKAAAAGGSAIVFSLLDMNEDSSLDGLELLDGTLLRFDADRNGEVSRAEYLAGNPAGASQTSAPVAAPEPAPAPPVASRVAERPLPSGKLDDAKKVELIATTLEGFQAGINAGSFRRFHELYLSNLWKKQLTADGFEQAFRPFLDQKPELDPSAFRAEPVFTTDKKDGSINKFAGHYLVRTAGGTAKVTWELDYMTESSRGWGLTRVKIFSTPQ